MRKFKPGIRFRLLLLGTLPAGLIVLGLVAYILYIRVNSLELGLKERGEIIARQLANACAHSISSGNQALLQNMTDAVLDENDIMSASVYDHSGNLLANSALKISSLGNEPGLVSQPTLVFTSPIMISDESDSRYQSQKQVKKQDVLGKVRIELSLLNASEIETVIIRNTFLITIVGLAISGGLAYRMGRKVSKPILDLTNSVLAISKGDLDTRVTYQADPELNNLKVGFNTMATELKRNQENLERQIFSATLRLQNSLRSLERRNSELEQARLEAETQNKTKSDFLAQISHEIRTPMNGIIGFTELLATSPLSPQQIDQLQLIEKSAKSLLSIINEILDLSILESGKFSVKEKEYRIRPYLEDAIALLTQQALEVEIILLIEPMVPTMIKGDPIRMQQVVTNLLGNALKFTYKGKVVIRVRCMEDKNQNWILFTVSDNGCGIPSHYLANLFSPFLQFIDMSTRREHSVGLGLTIGKNIVERMNGQIGVISRVSHGSTFWFALPLFRCLSPSNPNPGFLITLIDSDPLSRKALESQLHALGSNVWHIDSIEYFTNDHTQNDIIVLSLAHTEIDIHTLKSWIILLKSKKNLPVLILGNTRQQMEDLYEKVGADAGLTLPCRSEYLFKTLHTLVNTSPEKENNVDPTSKLRHLAPDARILIADDNEINRILLKTQLSGTVAKIIECKDGQEALDVLKITPFDLIFLDLQMPSIKGMDVVCFLKNTPNVNAETPVIAITAHALPEQKNTVIKAGFVDCLIKPIVKEQIDSMVQQWLPQKHVLTYSELNRPLFKETTYYVKKLFEKTDDNKELSGTIFSKLFTELRQQIKQIETALSEHDLPSAQSITHRLHGSVSFCGFDNIKKVALKFETNLLNEKTENLTESFADLKAEVSSLLDLEREILKHFRN